MVPAVPVLHPAEKDTFSWSLAESSKARCCFGRVGAKEAHGEECSLTFLQQEREGGHLTKAHLKGDFLAGSGGALPRAASCPPPLFSRVPPLLSSPFQLLPFFFLFCASCSLSFPRFFPPASRRRRTQKVVRVNLGSSIWSPGNKASPPTRVLSLASLICVRLASWCQRK